MTSKIIYQGNLRTQATHLQSGNAIITDAPIDNHGKGEAFSPTDLVATALGSCMLTVMGIYAQREGIDLQGTEVDITKIMADQPRRIAEIVVNIRFPSTLVLTDKQRQILIHTAETCPVHFSLHPDLKRTIRFE